MKHQSTNTFAFVCSPNKVEYDEVNHLAVFGDGNEPTLIALPNADLPLQVRK